MENYHEKTTGLKGQRYWLNSSNRILIKLRPGSSDIICKLVEEEETDHTLCIISYQG
jgi:hypothetical protein